MKHLLIALTLFTTSNAYAADNAVDTLLAEYETAGGKDFSVEAGQTLWLQTFDTDGQQRSCGTCHGDDLQESGKHARTGKVIEPLAPSVNDKRLTDIKHIKKWLLRNCKWTLGRECEPQEKGDLLVFLRQQ
jgi:hypothetical protein